MKFRLLSWEWMLSATRRDQICLLKGSQNRFENKLKKPILQPIMENEGNDLSVVLFSHSALVSLASCLYSFPFPSLSFPFTHMKKKKKKNTRKQTITELGVRIHSCNPITLEAEAGGML